LDPTDSHLLLTLFVGSLLGSWHCAVMCGGLASYASLDRKILPYQGGRWLSYIFLGALSGWGGKVFLDFTTDKIHIFVSILVGLFLLLSIHRIWAMPTKNHAVLFFQKLRPNKKRPFVWGLATGLLPCHWLYVYLLAAWTTKDPFTGILVMTVFWLGNLPYLLLFQLFFKDLVYKLPPRTQQWVSTVMIISCLYSVIIKNYF
jgi:sulfite exporter TauE/SafE